jgi:N-acetyl-D-muramate 6-phosphate phosphatase
MPLDVARIRAICFDIDGTLKDTDDQMVRQIAKLFKPLSWLLPDLDRQLYARRMVMSLDEPGNFIKNKLDIWHIDGWLTRMSENWSRPDDQPKKKLPLIVPGVREMLARLSSHYLLAVVSARDQRSTQFFLDGYNLMPFFRIVVTEQTCQYTKPYPDPIFWAADQMEVPAEHCLMVGDTTVDIHAGRAAGSQTVGVLCGFSREKELIRAGADLILSTTAELIDLLL